MVVAVVAVERTTSKQGGRWGRIMLKAVVIRHAVGDEGTRVCRLGKGVDVRVHDEGGSIGRVRRALPGDERAQRAKQFVTRGGPIVEESLLRL